MHLAVEVGGAGCESVVAGLIEVGAHPIDDRNELGECALAVACLAGNGAAVRVMLERSADGFWEPLVTGTGACLAHLCATAAAGVEMMELALEMCPDPTRFALARDARGALPAAWVADLSDPGVAVALLELLDGVAPGKALGLCPDGTGPLWLACASGSFGCAEWLIRRKGLDPHFQSDRGVSPLWIAAAHARVEIVRLILAERAPPTQRDLEAVDAERGWTCLFASLMSGHEATAVALAEWAMANHPNALAVRCGGVPYSLASNAAGLPGLARRLAKHGGCVDDMGRAAGWYSAAGGHLPATDALESDVVWAAALHGHLDLARELLQAGNTAPEGKEDLVAALLGQGGARDDVNIANTLLRLPTQIGHVARAGVRGGSSQCAICLDEPFWPSDMVMVTNCCKIPFHIVCLQQWFARGQSTCPTCRASIRRK